jgi:hypothetical protein
MAELPDYYTWEQIEVIKLLCERDEQVLAYEAKIKELEEKLKQYEQ